MSNSADKTKRHFIRGIKKHKEVLYAPLIQVVKFCQRFPTYTAQHIGEMITQAMKELKDRKELLNTVPEVEEVKKPDGGIDGKSQEETQERTTEEE